MRVITDSEKNLTNKERYFMSFGFSDPQLMQAMVSQKTKTMSIND